MKSNVRTILREGLLLFAMLAAGLAVILAVIVSAGAGVEASTVPLTGNLAIVAFFAVIFAPTFETAVLCLNYRLVARLNPVLSIGIVAIVFGLLHWSGPARFLLGLYGGAVFAYFIWRLLNKRQTWSTVYWTLALGHFLLNLAVLVTSRTLS